jgi:hypothetical protein
MDKLPDDILSLMTTYCPVASCWSLSRTCKHAYLAINKKIYSIFKKQFLHNVWKREFIYNAPIQNLFDFFEVKEYVYVGSLVWSTLLGETWKNDHIEVNDLEYRSQIEIIEQTQRRRRREIQNGLIIGRTRVTLSYKTSDVHSWLFPYQSFFDEFKGCPMYLKFANIYKLEGKSHSHYANEHNIIGACNYFDPINKYLYIRDAGNALFKRSTIDNLFGSEEVIREKVCGYKTKGIEFI